jgi:hypothetical protein
LPSQLDTCLGRIDIPVYLQRVVAGLSDADEIKGERFSVFPAGVRLLTLFTFYLAVPATVICFLSLARLAHVAPAPVTQILDNVSDSFTETMKAFVGGKDTVKQEFDRKVRCPAPQCHACRLTTTFDFCTPGRDPAIRPQDHLPAVQALHACNVPQV